LDDTTTRTETTLQTAYGEATITDDHLYSFKQGVVGLPQANAFALLPFSNSDLFVLQSLNNDLSFILIPAIKVNREFSFHIDQETVELLGAKNADEVIVMLIVHLIDNKPFINCKAPILIVPPTQSGCQFVINDASYGIREELVMKGLEQC